MWARAASRAESLGFTWRWFGKTLGRNCAVVGVSMAIGDAVCQKIEHKKGPYAQQSDFEWDSRRSFNMWLVGTFSSAPVSHVSMVGLEMLIPGSSRMAVIGKVVTNGLWAFFVSLPIFFTATSLINGKSMDEAGSKVEAELVRTFLAGSLYWPFVNYLNFSLVKIDHRATVGSLFGLLWHVFLSFRANDSLDSSDSEDRVQGESKGVVGLPIQVDVVNSRVP